METEILNIVINLQKKYTKLNEIYNITKQMEESLYRDDYVALKMVMDMRTDVMLEVDEIDYEREALIDNLSETKKECVKSAMKKGFNQESSDYEPYVKINEIYMKINRTLENIINIDKLISLKISNENTYYK